MKQILFLFIIILSSCHVHYHFKDAAVKCPLNVSGPLPFVTEGAFYPIGDIRIIGEKKGCGMVGCGVYHSHYPMDTWKGIRTPNIDWGNVTEYQSIDTLFINYNDTIK